MGLNTATGAVKDITYRGGTIVTNGYDLRDRLTEINDINSTSGLPFAAQYAYLNNSNIDLASAWNPNIRTDINLTESDREFTYDYSYDGLNRLTGADYKLNSTNPASFDLPSIAYDGNGNITGMQRNSPAGTLVDDLGYNYGNQNNQLSSLTDGAGTTAESWDAESASFGYDPSGNPCPPTGVMTSQTGKFSDIAYDHRNLPVHFYLSSGAELIANYNGDACPGPRPGRQRILKELKGGAWQFYVKDGARTLAVIDQDGLSHINLFGNSVFGRIEANSGTISTSNARRYYITDHLGSTRAVVDDGGNVLETFDYYPFGLLMPKRNTAGANTIEKFTGKERDTEGNLNLDYFGARYYDPAIGRFTSSDPILDDLYPSELLKDESRLLSTTSYGYVFGNPVNLIDPDGKCPTCDDPEELKRFEQAQISEGLQFMLNLSVANQDQVKEVSSYLVQNENNEATLVVFDPEGNTKNTSSNPDVGITESGKVVYGESEVVAQIHTHPGGSPTPSPADEKVSESLRSPVFTLTDDNIGVTIGSGFRSRTLGKDFKNSVVNKGRSDRLIDYARDLKEIIENSRN